MDVKYYVLATAVVCFLTACKRREPLEVTSTETRPISTRDGEVKLDATSNERFGLSAPAPSPEPSEGGTPTFADQAPQTWKKLPSNMFRTLNYSFGTNGEVYLSQSMGSVLDNTNRWLGQFSKEKLDAAGLQQLPTVDFLGTKAIWIEADGTFEPGMGKPTATGYALAGVIAEVNGGIVTVKMTGPKAEVETEKAALRSYLSTLKIAE